MEQQYVAIRWSNYDTFINESHFDEKVTDVTLACDGQKLCAHKEVLSAVSPFFNIILKDIDPPQYPVIIIADLSFEDIQAIVQFLYSGETLTPVNRIHLLAKAAEKLQIRALIDGLSSLSSVKKSHAKKISKFKHINHHDPKTDNYEDMVKSKKYSKRQLEIQKQKIKGIIKQNHHSQEPSLKGKRKKRLRRRNKSNNEQQLVVIPETAYSENAQITIDPQKSIATIASTNEDGTTTTTVSAVKVLPIVDTVTVNIPLPAFCDNCGVLCQNEAILRGHKKIHNFQSTNDTLSNLLDTDNGNNRKVQKRNKLHVCPYCPYSSEHNTNLAHHIRTHTGEKPHTCSVCGRSFTRKETLNHHMRSHTGERPFECNICNKKFLFKHNLTSHLILHTGEKPHSCSICDKSFALKTSLKKHMQSHKYIYGEENNSCSDGSEVIVSNNEQISNNEHFSINLRQSPINDNSCNTLQEISSTLEMNSDL